MDTLNKDPSMKHTQSIPILVDNSMNRAFAIKYAIYALFGFAGVLTSIPSITDVAGETVATIVAAVVMTSALICACAAWRTERGRFWQKLEIYSTISLISFVLVYNVCLVWLAVTGDMGRVGVAVISTALLVFPVWRCRYLAKRVAAN